MEIYTKESIVYALFYFICCSGNFMEKMHLKWSEMNE